MTSIFNVSVVCLLNVLFWSPNENKLTLLFVRGRDKSRTGSTRIADLNKNSTIVHFLVLE